MLFQQADGEDELKKRQLMELAIINGTYRDSSAKAAVASGIARRIGCHIRMIQIKKWHEFSLITLKKFLSKLTLILQYGTAMLL